MQYVFLCGNWDFVNVAVITTAVLRNRGICDIFTVIFPAGMGQFFVAVTGCMGMGHFKKRGNAKSPITAVIIAVITAREYCCLKKNLNAPRPSEHPPVRGKKCQNV